MKIKINIIWKIASILFLLLAIVFFVKGNYDQKNMDKNFEDCELKRNICITILNESLMAWYDTIVGCGEYCFNLSEEDIREYILNIPLNNSFDSLIKFQEDKNE